jgi:hypothetical protein
MARLNSDKWKNIMFFEEKSIFLIFSIKLGHFKAQTIFSQATNTQA